VDPGPVLDAWEHVPTVKRAFIHAEIKKPLAPLLKKIKSYGWEAGIAINPNTGWEVVEPYIGHNAPQPPLTLRGGERLIDAILFMTVYPGQNGAPFQPKVVPKIAQFHKAHPEMLIEVDGGVSAATLPLLLKAGVTRFAVGSAIWSAPDPLKAYKNLLKQITH